MYLLFFLLTIKNFATTLRKNITQDEFHVLLALNSITLNTKLMIFIIIRIVKNIKHFVRRNKKKLFKFIQTN